MQACWNINAGSRPSFGDISNFLQRKPSQDSKSSSDSSMTRLTTCWPISTYYYFISMCIFLCQLLLAASTCKKNYSNQLVIPPPPLPKNAGHTSLLSAKSHFFLSVSSQAYLSSSPQIRGSMCIADGTGAIYYHVQIVHCIYDNLYKQILLFSSRISKIWNILYYTTHTEEFFLSPKA